MRKKNIKLHGITSGVFYENFGKFRFSRTQDNFRERVGSLNWSRFYILYAVAIGFVLLFLGRLFNLTVISGERNRELSDNNRIRIIETEGDRGKIFDRRGRLLAESVQKFWGTASCTVVIENKEHLVEVITLLKKLIPDVKSANESI